MISKPLISIIIPFYNSEKTIVSTLQSVVEQTYKNIEILLINDGSTDESLTMVKSFISNHENFKISLFEQKNKGVSAARNSGIVNSKGDFIAFLDSDDFWKPQKLERQLEIFSKYSQVDLLATNRNGEKFDHFLFLKFERVTRISGKILLYKNFLLTPTVLLKREIINSVGLFNENFKFSEDYEFFLRCSKKHNCFLLNESLVITGNRKPSYGFSGLSANLWEMEKGELRTIKLGYEMQIIDCFEYLFISAFSLMKFFRRFVITFIKKLHC